jgi:D-amino-acid dehydrogenase
MQSETPRSVIAPTEDVVVIGGGVIGVCCAAALARAGRSVLLLEQSNLCAGSSWGNAGLLTTSACAPEAGPGVMRQAMRWMLDRDSPFTIRVRASRDQITWIRRFRSYCNSVAANRAMELLRDLVRQNIRLVVQQAGMTDDFSLKQDGLIVLYESQNGLVEGMRGASQLSSIGIPSRQLSREELTQFEPRSSAALAGALFFPEDAHLDPGKYVRAIADMAVRNGARVREDVTVTRLHGSHRIERVETDRGSISPGLVVLANGAWASSLLRGVVQRVLVEPGKGYSLTYDAGSEVFARPLRLFELRTVVSSMSTKIRVTTKMDLVGLDTRVREKRILGAAARAQRYVDLPGGIGEAHRWAGLRPLTPDGLPLIGFPAHVDNLILATGHGHLGISLGAVTGEAVAQLAGGRSTTTAPDDLTPFSPQRFENS